MDWLKFATGTIRFSELREEEQDNVAVAVYNTHFLEHDDEEGTPSKDEVLAWLKAQDTELKTATVKVDDLISQIADEHWGTHAEKASPLLETLRRGEELDPILLDGDRLVDGAHRTMAAHEHGLEELPSVDIGPLLKTRPKVEKGAEGAKKEPEAEPHSMDVDPGWGSAYGKVAVFHSVAIGYDGRTLAIDFDGTLAQLTPDKRPGEPIPGALEALERLREQGYTVLIWSNRTKTPGGEEEVRVWMDEHGASFDGIISGEKPAHVLFVDNQAVRFTGDWGSTLQEIVELEASESANPAEMPSSASLEVGMAWLKKKSESAADEKRDVELAESIEDDAEDVEEKAEDIGDKASDLSEREQKEVEEMEKHFGQTQ